MAISIHTPIQDAGRIDKRILPALKRLGIETVRDLLFHFPSRYEDFSNEKKIADVFLGETVTLRGTVEKISVHRTFRKRMALTEAVIRDETGNIKAVWFNQPFIAKNVSEGSAVLVSGKIAKGPGGNYLQNPSYERVGARAIHTGGLVAVYPESWGITSRWLRYLISQFIGLRAHIKDSLKDSVRVRNQLPLLGDALYNIHFPKTKKDAETAERRFSFENLFFIQLRALRERGRLKQNHAPKIPLDVSLIKKFTASLPFPFTDAQRRSLWEIASDMAKPSPMNRLLEGDVGSGKTVVAAAAALLAARAGYRAVFMAPTEILARQHFATLEKFLSPFGVSLGFCTGAEKRADRADIVAGTHALIQKNISFENLGLVVVDEQHRFGVRERAHLVKNGSEEIPHFLSMSATPIPRTLALTVYGDLDLSILDEMPKYRKAVITKVIDSRGRADAYQRIREEVLKGRQVFVICPRIDLPDPNASATKRAYQQKLLLSEVKSVKEEYKKLSEGVFKDLRVSMLHGKMKAKEKALVMERFRRQESDILVSTSVVEVGIDIPNASVMMIEGAERFGLAQLHQFRGRVGRGADQSYCFLFSTEDGIAARRLRAVEEAKNGFELAQKDLEIRGPGDFFGTAQSGFSRDLLKGVSDPELVRAARREAIEILRADPALSDSPEIKKRLAEFEAVHWE